MKPEHSLPPLHEATPAFLTVAYQPAEGSTSAENPPRFAWLPDVDEGAAYLLDVQPVDAPANTPGSEPFQAHTGALNFHAPAHLLAPGQWRWRYCLWNAAEARAASGWSCWRTFVLPATAVNCPGMDLGTLPNRTTDAHPRLWLSSDEVLELRTALLRDPTHLGWPAFMNEAVLPWTEREPPAEPAPYPGHKRVLALWRQSYIDMQELLYGVRHLAVAGTVLNDPVMRLRARDWLLHTARFDLRGSTSRAYNDEAAFRVAVALAWGYDWLHDVLSDAERDTVRSALAARIEEVAEHVFDHARIQLFPYDSHAVRAVGMVLVPGCIALLGEHPRAQEWLQFSIAYYDTLYSPWGGADGGWAEGPHYWTTAMACFTEAAALLKKFCGHDLMQRAFTLATGDFPLYTKAPDAQRGSFCDDPTLGETVSLKVGQLMRHFAGITGRGVYSWYDEQVRARDPGTAQLYYNHGWWSLPFDALRDAHDHPQVGAVEPSALPELKHFADVGWVAVQRRLHEPERHLQFITKCSRFGSLSHSHGDQGAFSFFAYGEDLGIQSGYYIGHNSSMHRRWRKRTLSKNALLIDGRGQYDGDDKARQIQAQGRVLQAATLDDGRIVISLDPSAAYRSEVPELRQYRRDFHLFPGDQLLVIDQLELSVPLPLQWRLHALQLPQLGRRSFQIPGARASLTGEVVFCAAGAPTLQASTGFADVDLAEIAGAPLHHHVALHTPAATRHALAVLLTPQRTGENNRLFHFIDDQGFATQLYFNDAANRSFNVTLEKAF
jgi:Heparinase II/III-like protein/Domain of unknown function (DUF4962)